MLVNTVLMLRSVTVIEQYHGICHYAPVTAELCSLGTLFCVIAELLQQLLSSNRLGAL